MTDAQLIAATPAFRNEGMTVVTRRLDAPGGNTVVSAGSVAFADPQPDASDPNVMLVDFIADYSYDGNTSSLVEAWAKQNAPIIGNFDAVQLSDAGDNGYRGTLRVPVAAGMHFTLLKVSPATMSGATSVDPSWFFTGLPYDSTYVDPPQELFVWVAEQNGAWQTFVKPHPGAPAPPPPASQLPNSGNPPSGNPPPGNPPLRIDTISASPTTVDSQQGFTLQATVSGGTGSLSHQWTQFAGPAAAIDSSQALATAAVAPVVSGSQLMEFAFTVTDQNGGVTRTVGVTVQPAPVVNNAPVHVATTVAGVDSSSSVIAALTKAIVEVSFRDDDGDALSCLLERRAGETAAISLVSSATAANITTFTFEVVVVSDPVPAPGTFSFDALAEDPGGLQAASPQRQVTVFRRNRFAELVGYRDASAQVDALNGLVNEGPGTFAIGTVTSASVNEVDLEVFIDFPQNWVGEDNSLQPGWTPHLFRNPLNGGVPADYYNGTPLTPVIDYGTGTVCKAVLRLRTDVGDHLLWATRHGGSNPGDPANVFMVRQDRNHNFDDVDPDQGLIIVIDPILRNVTMPTDPALPP